MKKFTEGQIVMVFVFGLAASITLLITCFGPTKEQVILPSGYITIGFCAAVVLIVVAILFDHLGNSPDG